MRNEALNFDKQTKRAAELWDDAQPIEGNCAKRKRAIYAKLVEAVESGDTATAATLRQQYNNA